MPLELLPLRGRKKDIAALILYFIKQFNKEYKLHKTITEEASELLQRFEWPGNIRELENVMERIMISFDGDTITKFQVERASGIPIETSIDMPVADERSMKEMLEESEKYILKSMMSKYRHASDVGRAVKMNKSTLSRRLRKYDLDK